MIFVIYRIDFLRERQNHGAARERQAQMLERGGQETMALRPAIQVVLTASMSGFHALSFWTMKRRAGAVGESFGREALRPRRSSRRPCSAAPAAARSSLSTMREERDEG